MKKINICLIALLLLSLTLKAQTIPDSIKYRVQQHHFKQFLRIDALKAKQVAVIQEEYRDGIKALFRSSELDTRAKAHLMVRLDSIRLSKLGTLLGHKELAIMQKIK